MNSETTSPSPAAAVAQPAPPPPETLTYSVTETAHVLGVSLPTVYRLIARRVFKPLPGLRHKRLPKRQVHAFVNSGPPLSV
ncbi:MAG TPA: helix-turn-helix domain-containing protein [Opitutaceae bacterium]|nr:helix-turn-helix domain-containing protein [Opitutaceae bacterium]